MSFGWVVGCIALDAAVIFANLVEECLIIRKWKNLDRIDHLMLSLSVSDLISGIATLSIDCWFLSVIQLGGVTPKNLQTFITVSYIFDSVFLFSVFASVLHVVAVAIERLYAIKFPTKYHVFNTYKCKLVTMLFIWSLSLVLTPVFTVIAIYTDRPKLGQYVRGIVFMIAITSVLILYVLIAYFLVRQKKLIVRNFNRGGGVEQERLKRLTVTCLFIGISFVICLLPITLSYFDSYLYHDFSNLLVTLNSLINPCVYLAKVYYDARATALRRRSNTAHALLEIRCTASVATNSEDQAERNMNCRAENCCCDA